MASPGSLVSSSAGGSFAVELSLSLLVGKSFWKKGLVFSSCLVFLSVFLQFAMLKLTLVPLCHSQI